jgi:hypothetical protein
MGELLLVLVALFVAVVGHEVAHLVAARLVGHEVFEIHIGVGPAFAERIGGVDVRVGLLPLGGHVQTGARDDDGFRWRSAVVAGSGVVANVVLLGIAVTTGYGALATFNVLAIGFNLWPGGRRVLGRPSSDGRTLLDLLRRDEDAMAEERSAWFCVEAGRAREDGDLDRAVDLVEEGIETVGPTRALLAVRGVLAFEQQRFVDVVDAYAHLIDDARVTVPARAGFAADAAWAASLSEDPELRRLAEPWAGFARAARPGVERRRIIHGLALVDAGRPDDAVDAVARLGDPLADAVRVLALASSGDRVAARDLYVTRIDGAIAPDHPLRRRVEDALSGPTG